MEVMRVQYYAVLVFKVTFSLGTVLISSRLQLVVGLYQVLLQDLMDPMISNTYSSRLPSSATDIRNQMAA